MGGGGHMTSAGPTSFLGPQRPDGRQATLIGPSRPTVMGGRLFAYIARRLPLICLRQSDRGHPQINALPSLCRSLSMAHFDRSRAKHA
jgi:hypothetical protein